MIRLDQHTTWWLKKSICVLAGQLAARLNPNSKPFTPITFSGTSTPQTASASARSQHSTAATISEAAERLTPRAHRSMAQKALPIQAQRPALQILSRSSSGRRDGAATPEADDSTAAATKLQEAQAQRPQGVTEGSAIAPKPVPTPGRSPERLEPGNQHADSTAQQAVQHLLSASALGAPGQPLKGLLPGQQGQLSLPGGTAQQASSSAAMPYAPPLVPLMKRLSLDGISAAQNGINAQSASPVSALVGSPAAPVRLQPVQLPKPLARRPMAPLAKTVSWSPPGTFNNVCPARGMYTQKPVVLARLLDLHTV